MLKRNTKAGGTVVGGSSGFSSPPAKPVNGFPGVGEVLWEIGMIVVALLGLAFAANILCAHGAG